MHSIVLFDLDGTLLDTSSGIFFTANQTMVRLGFNPVDEVRLRSFVGPPLATCFKVACDLEEEYIEEACRIYREIYDRDGAKYKAEVYTGIGELLEKLQAKGVTMAVATLKFEPLAVDILDHFKLLPFFKTVVGADYGGELTKTDIIVKAMRRLGEGDYHKALMVGDTQIDLEGSLEANTKFVGVDWGFGFEKGERLEAQGHILGMIEEPHHLLTLL